MSLLHLVNSSLWFKIPVALSMIFLSFFVWKLYLTHMQYRHRIMFDASEKLEAAGLTADQAARASLEIADKYFPKYRIFWIIPLVMTINTFLYCVSVFK